MVSAENNGPHIWMGIFSGEEGEAKPGTEPGVQTDDIKLVLVSSIGLRTAGMQSDFSG